MRILVTRPEPEATSTARQIEALGFSAAIHPLLVFKALEFDTSALEAAQGLIITSASALNALEQKGALGAAARLPLYCVGEATAAKAKTLGFTTIIGVAPTAAELADLILAKADPSSTLVHTSGVDRAFDMQRTLSRASPALTLTTINVYRMVALDHFEPWLVQDLEAGAIDGVVLLSPRCAETFVALCLHHKIQRPFQKITAFCLSDAIRRKLKPWPFAGVEIASEPTLSALLTLMAATTDRVL